MADGESHVAACPAMAETMSPAQSEESPEETAVDNCSEISAAAPFEALSVEEGRSALIVSANSAADSEQAAPLPDTDYEDVVPSGCREDALLGPCEQPAADIVAAREPCISSLNSAGVEGQLPEQLDRQQHENIDCKYSDDQDSSEVIGEPSRLCDASGNMNSSELAVDGASVVAESQDSSSQQPLEDEEHAQEHAQSVHEEDASAVNDVAANAGLSWFTDYEGAPPQEASTNEDSGTFAPKYHPRCSFFFSLSALMI